MRAKPALSSAAALESPPVFDLELGMVHTQSAQSARNFGVRGGARMGWGPVAGEVALSARLPGDPVSGLTHTLVAIAYEGNPGTSFQAPVSIERGSVSAYALASPWTLREGPGLALWPHARLGADLRWVDDRVATVDQAWVEGDADAEAAALSSEPENRLAPAGGAGLGLDAWVDARVGLGLSYTVRVGREREPDYGNRSADGTPVPLDPVWVVSGAAVLTAMVRL